MIVARRGSRRLFPATVPFRQPQNDVAVALARAAGCRQAIERLGIEGQGIPAPDAAF